MSDTATQFMMLMNYFFYLFSTNEEYVTSIISNSGIEGKEEVDMNVRDFGYSVYSLWFYCSGNFLKLFCFQIFQFLTYLMKVIPGQVLCTINLISIFCLFFF